MIWFESKYKFDFFLFGIFQYLSMRGPNLNLKNWNSNFISVKIVFMFEMSCCTTLHEYLGRWTVCHKIIDRGVVLPEENHPRIRVIHISELQSFGWVFNSTSRPPKDFCSAARSTSMPTAARINDQHSKGNEQLPPFPAFFYE